MKKLNIKLKPYTAITILSFLREYINDDVKDIPEFKAIRECVDEFEMDVYRKMDDDQFEDACIENSINQMTGRSPKR